MQLMWSDVATSHISLYIHHCGAVSELEHLRGAQYQFKPVIINHFKELETFRRRSQLMNDDGELSF